MREARKGSGRDPVSASCRRYSQLLRTSLLRIRASDPAGRLKYAELPVRSAVWLPAFTRATAPHVTRRGAVLLPALTRTSAAYARRYCVPAAPAGGERRYAKPQPLAESVLGVKRRRVRRRRAGAGRLSCASEDVEELFMQDRTCRRENSSIMRFLQQFACFRAR